MARLEQMLEMVKKDRDVRQNLIQIRQNISDESLRRSFMYLLGGDYTLLTDLLGHEDPKVRKNAALILGMTEDEDVLPALFDAWEKEETLFVREDYLKAASMLDYREYLPKLKERILELEKMLGDGQSAADEDAVTDGQAAQSEPEKEEASENESLWDNNKHLLLELSRLRSMVSRYERRRNHTYAKMSPAPDVILQTNRLHADVTAAQIHTGTVNAMRGAVHVKGGDMEELLKVRTWTEMLFPIPGTRPVAGDEKTIAQKLRDLKIGNYLKYLHEESDQPFRYRIELKSQSIPREKKGEFIQRIASRLDALERGVLQNTDSGYEVELRLIERRDKSFIPMLKLFTIPDRRYAYRKETTAQSTSAPLAALAVELARPYLKEGAQLLDPFCGTGTLLMERCIAAGADPVYGVDKFGEAVAKAKINTEITRSFPHAPFHFINRDFFDFTHEYSFDEVITELPKEEAAGDNGKEFTRKFLEKVRTLLSEGAVLTVLTDNARAMEDALESEKDFTLAESFLLNERAGTREFILRFR